MKTFALIGAAGYVAPRHMKAIAETGNKLVAALDHSDSVGILDSYFPDTAFFTELERFDRHLEKLKRKGQAVDYLCICSPNYLHDAHIRFGLRYGASVICEKPVVLSPWNLRALAEIEEECSANLHCILQLRLHKEILKLKKKVESSSEENYEIDLTYLTPRGKWYYASWKGDEEKSGGIATNIGVHFFDMLNWIFGAVKENTVYLHNHDRASGYLELDRANVKWFLSINPELNERESEQNAAHRSMEVNGEDIQFSSGFQDLHTESYEKILSGEGFALKDAEASVALIHEIRTSKLTEFDGREHPMARKAMAPHPFSK